MTNSRGTYAHKEYTKELTEFVVRLHHHIACDDDDRARGTTSLLALAANERSGAAGA